MRQLVQYLPIATSMLALTFSTVLYERWRLRGGPRTASRWRSWRAS